MNAPKQQNKIDWDSLTPRQREETQRKKDREACNEPGYNKALVARAQKRMARVDAMSPELRRVVYEYNLEVVQEFLNHGVKTPKSIKHLIDTVTGADFVNGQPRFKLNRHPNAKRNEIDLADDDDYYEIKK